MQQITLRVCFSSNKFCELFAFVENWRGFFFAGYINLSSMRKKSKTVKTNNADNMNECSTGFLKPVFVVKKPRKIDQGRHCNSHLDSLFFCKDCSTFSFIPGRFTAQYYYLLNNISELCNRQFNFSCLCFCHSLQLLCNCGYIPYAYRF